MAAAPALPPAARAAATGHRCEAIVLDWNGPAAPDRSSDASTLLALVESACRLGLHVCVLAGADVPGVRELARLRPPGPGTLHILLERRPDPVRQALDLLWRLGVSPAQVLLAGDDGAAAPD